MEAPERFYLKRSMDGPSCEYVRGDIVESIRQQRRDEHSEIERLRSLLRRLVLNAPGAFRGGEPDVGQYNEWFTAIREAAEAAKEKS